ncbi:hypothetical protein F5050DRAFT_1716707 [Lentinula boryana]|uniref:Uncharacterized protein n=1 Tax=Lentinula boryana TaxID=40481 RepID=A0ABQ8PWG4_9AGAR|nr:hypothetical protein F5050DRAFT_1716707 [Lentinula boryana]
MTLNYEVSIHGFIVECTHSGKSIIERSFKAFNAHLTRRNTVDAYLRAKLLLRDMMDAVQRREEPAWGTLLNKHRSQSDTEPQGGFDMDDEEESDALDDGFDDDSRSVGTVVPHELERVDEEDEESALAADNVLKVTVHS